MLKFDKNAVPSLIFFMTLCMVTIEEASKSRTPSSLPSFLADPFLLATLALFSHSQAGPWSPLPLFALSHSYMRNLNLLTHPLPMEKLAVPGCASDDKEVSARASSTSRLPGRLTMSREPSSRASPLRSWFHHWCWLDWACWCWSWAFHKWCGWCHVVQNKILNSTPDIREPKTKSRAASSWPKHWDWRDCTIL